MSEIPMVKVLDLHLMRFILKKYSRVYGYNITDFTVAILKIPLISKYFSAMLKETKQNLRPFVLEGNDNKSRPSQIY